jgi:type VI protein secretion system component Hcp
MPLHAFPLKNDGANGHSTVNAFEDWFAVNGPDIGVPTAFLPLTDAAGTSGQAQGSLAAAATPVPASSPLHYFLKVDGVTGDSTVKGFEGWFSVDGFDLGVKNISSPSAGTGGGAGKAQFSPLTVDIHSLTGLASLFGDAASGHVLPKVELAGVETIKGQSLKVYDIKLSDVSVSGFENDPGPNGVETELTLNFTKISVTDQPPGRHGRPGTPQTATFDLKANTAIATLSPSDLLFDGTAPGPAGLMAPGDTGSTGRWDHVLHPTLTTHS